ncbi:MAG TPA: glycosyltransferase family 39 protein [Candidatus Kapabacteria bacterium]|nr:glycosyltransferase family 39 protein [Candidatus Kapabacteria bacterium]
MPSQFLTRILSGRNERRTLLIISFVVFIIQVLTLRSTVIIGEPYIIATHLRDGLGFVFEFPWDTYPTPTCFIPPLYAYYLYVILLVGGGFFIMQCINLIFFHVSNFFLYHFFKRYTSKQTAFAGFVIYAFYVPLWLLAQKIDPDGLNILLVTATIYILDGIMKDLTTRRWVMLGVLFGVQILVRPDILLGILFFGAFLFFASKQKTAFIKGFSLSIAIALLMVVPWTIRNYNVFGRFVLVSANSGYNLFLGNNPAATGEFDQQPPSPQSISMDSARIVYFSMHQSGVERDSYLYHVAVDWATAHPFEVMKLAAKKFYYHWWLRESSGHFIQTPQWMLVTYNIGSLLLVVLGFIGLFSLETKARWLLLTLFAYSTAIAMIFFVQSRHRALKVDPFLITLSVVAVSHMFKKKSEPSPSR